MNMQVDTLRMSSGERYYKCPGARKAELGVPHLDVNTEAADSGHRVHTATLCWYTQSLLQSNLTGREAHIAMWMSRKISDVLQKDKSPTSVQLLDWEVALELPGWTGHADLIAQDSTERKAWVFEFKTGRNPQACANEHIQGRLYTTAAAHKYGWDKTWTIKLIILAAGNDEDEAKTECQFDSDDIEMAARDADTIKKNTESPNAPRNIGDHCQYCPAKGIPHRCPESCEQVAMVVRDFREELLADPAKLGEIASQWKRAEKIGNRIMAAVNYAQEQGIEVPGWERHKGRSLPVINAEAAFNALCPSQISRSAFLGCLKVGIGNLVNAACEKSGINKSACERDMREVLKANNALHYEEGNAYPVEVRRIK